MHTNEIFNSGCRMQDTGYQIKREDCHSKGFQRNYPILSGIRYLVSCIIILLFPGCKDVFEEDITHSKIVINAPIEGTKSTIYKQLFWWNAVEGASQYTIQIASPSFDSLQSIIDTTVSGTTKFYKTLAPGHYEWRIRAENGAYKTAYQTYSFTMLLSPLDQQEVSLLSPADNSYGGYSSGGLMNFSWEAMPGATHYEINIDTISANFGSNLLLNDETPDPAYSYTLPQGDYKWRVKAKDDSGNQTAWSEIYYTGYYATLPAVPTLSTPSNTSTTATFGWSAVSRAKLYTVYVYVDDTVSYTPQTYTVNAPVLSKTFTLPASALSGQKIYVKISATDKAGNTSTLSNSKNILVP